MSIARAIKTACRFLQEELGLEATPVAAQPLPEGWKVTVEAIVEDDYMRQRAKRDLLASFEVTLDLGLSVLAFERKQMRERGTA